MEKRIIFKSPRKQRFTEIIAVIGIILTALALRIARLPFLTMWSDEYHSFRVSSQPLLDILSGKYGGELNPPLYFAFLRFQRLIFGDSEIAMRSLSLFFATLSMVVFFKLSLSVFEAFIPSIAALTLMAFHPILIYYSVEICSYSLLVLLSLVSFFSCIKIQNKTKFSGFWTFLLTFSIVGCLYTHHFGLIAPIAIAAFVVTSAWMSRKWSKPDTLSLSGVLAAIMLYLPGLLMLRKQATSYPGQPNLATLIKSFQIFTSNMNQSTNNQLLIAFATITFFAGMIVLVSQVKDKHNTLIVILGIATAIIFILITHLAGINTISRYLILAIPLVLMAIAATLIPINKKWHGVINFFGVVTIGFYVISGTSFALNTKNENFQARWKADWRYISEVIEAHRRNHEPIAIMGWDATPIQYYLGEYTLNSFSLEEQYSNNLHSSFLVVITPNSRALSILDSSELLYEDINEDVRIFRLYSITNQ